MEDVRLVRERACIPRSFVPWIPIVLPSAVVTLSTLIISHHILEINVCVTKMRVSLGFFAIAVSGWNGKSNAASNRQARIENERHLVSPDVRSLIGKQGRVISSIFTLISELFCQQMSI